MAVSEVVTKPDTCKRCGVKVSRGKRGPKRQFCSKACCNHFHGYSVASAGDRVSVDCSICGRRFEAVVTGPGARPKRCSKSCKKEHARLLRKSKGRKRCPKPKNPTLKKCNRCGEIFLTTHPSRVHCSNDCRRLTQRIKRRKDSTARRARKKSAAIIERIEWLSVMESFGWKCQACGVVTSTDGDPHRSDDYPNLDHIVPLSAGGTHTLCNVQCLCRKCNSKKGTQQWD